MTEQDHLVEGPIPASLAAGIAAECEFPNSAGAGAMFLGKVRSDTIDGKTVEAIEYSAYEAMVGSVARQIREELFNEFSDLISVRMWHSTGIVKCGEISLLVAVTSGHRKHCFGALEKCVELIKEKLPVWKKELFTDGSSRWIE
jgi:molybdopterin synthase catalytic subunit